MKRTLQLLHRCVTGRRTKIVADDSDTSMIAGTGNRSELTNSSRLSDCNKSTTCRSREYDIAKKYIDAINNHDRKMFMMVVSPTAICDFDGLEVLGGVFLEMTEQIKKSFPDFHVAYEQIKVLSPGVVMICNLQVSGTHTGAPYTFGPFEEIEATGIKVQNDLEDAVLTIDMELELIIHFRFTSKGPLSGPQGLYEQLGGLII